MEAKLIQEWIDSSGIIVSMVYEFPDGQRVVQGIPNPESNPFLKLNWKIFPNAVPVPVVAGFVVDPQGRFPMLHRSDKVRSAPNRWSLPSGLHDVGETQAAAFCRELGEEIEIIAHPDDVVHFPAYENIPGDGWHWVISIMVVPTRTLDTFVNKEPDKHDQVEFFSYALLERPHAFANGLTLDPALAAWFIQHGKAVHALIKNIYPNLA